LAGRRLRDQELVAVLHRVYHPSIPDYRIPPTVRAKSLIAANDQPSISQPGGETGA
jgi:hypothetical protein